MEKIRRRRLVVALPAAGGLAVQNYRRPPISPYLIGGGGLDGCETK